MTTCDCWLFVCLGRQVSREIADALWDSRKDEERAELYQGAFISLRAEAEAMISGGVVLCPDDWLKLSRIEKEAFVAAKTRISIDQAMSIGQASRSAESASLLMAPIDGGELHDDLAFDSAFDQLSSTLKKKMGVNNAG